MKTIFESIYKDIYKPRPNLFLLLSLILPGYFYIFVSNRTYIKELNLLILPLCIILSLPQYVIMKFILFGIFIPFDMKLSLMKQRLGELRNNASKGLQELQTISEALDIEGKSAQNIFDNMDLILNTEEKSLNKKIRGLRYDIQKAKLEIDTRVTNMKRLIWKANTDLNSQIKDISYLNRQYREKENVITTLEEFTILFYLIILIGFAFLLSRANNIPSSFLEGPLPNELGLKLDRFSYSLYFLFSTGSLLRFLILLLNRLRIMLHPKKPRKSKQ